MGKKIKIRLLRLSDFEKHLDVMASRARRWSAWMEWLAR